MSYESLFLKNLVGEALSKPSKPPFEGFEGTHTGGIPASEWPAVLETWLRRSAWAVICFPSVEEAEQCFADLEGFLPPGRVTQVEGGATVQFDFRKHQPGN